MHGRAGGGVCVTPGQPGRGRRLRKFARDFAQRYLQFGTDQPPAGGGFAAGQCAFNDEPRPQIRAVAHHQRQRCLRAGGRANRPQLRINIVQALVQQNRPVDFFQLAADRFYTRLAADPFVLDEGGRKALLGTAGALDNLKLDLAQNRPHQRPPRTSPRVPPMVPMTRRFSSAR